MSNSLIPMMPGALQQFANSASAKDMFANLGGGERLLPSLRMPGGDSFAYQAIGAKDVVKLGTELKMIAIAAREVNHRTYFEGDYNTGDSSPPVCASACGVYPDQGSNKQATKCSACPHSVWGTGKTGNGTACRSFRRLVVLLLVKDKATGQWKPTPATTLDLPPNSLSNKPLYETDMENGKITWGTWAALGAQLSVPGAPKPHVLVLRAKLLEKTIVFRVNETLNEDGTSGAFIKQEWIPFIKEQMEREEVKKVLQGANTTADSNQPVEETLAPVEEAYVAPAPAPTPAPVAEKKTRAKKVVEVSAVVQPEDTSTEDGSELTLDNLFSSFAS